MVSFSCDHCQDVQTRKRVDSHFFRCRTRSVSCIDCGAQFDAHSVKGHTACITEAEKYEGGERKSSKSYCVTCNIAIPGLVAAEQHYNSKKHKKNERAINAKRNDRNPFDKSTVEKNGLKEGQVSRIQGVIASDENQNDGGDGGALTVNGKDERPTEMMIITVEKSLPMNDKKEGEKMSWKPERTKVKRLMKSILKQQQGKRMRRKKLISAIADSMAEWDVAKVRAEVLYLANKSRRFEESKRDIAMKSKTRECGDQ